jgi:hypothetical protein
MERVLYKKLMAKGSFSGLFLFIFERVASALLPVLFLHEALCSISPLIIYNIIVHSSLFYWLFYPAM